MKRAVEEMAMDAELLETIYYCISARLVFNGQR